MLPEYLNLRHALQVFAATRSGKHQSQAHIKPTHLHAAMRLVIEGGFFPTEITPRPPLEAVKQSGGWALAQAAEDTASGEATVFGGIKTKKLDVVAAKHGVGPVLAVSVKGTLGAFRNFANRMEEAIGDSTNIHVMYPGLVYGFLALVRANRQEEGFTGNDVAIYSDGSVSPQIIRHYGALSEMTGRTFVRNDFTRYEAVALALIEGRHGLEGEVNRDFPDPASGLALEAFFPRLLQVYDIRFPTRAPGLPAVRRMRWRRDSPVFERIREVTGEPLEAALGYEPRLSDED